ncbi:MAG: hypothetical protein ACHQU0_01615 [Candidatus Paceibacteria bacterium]
MATPVAGAMYYDLDGQLSEIKRQLRQPNGYPYNPEQLKYALQQAIEGKFPEVHQEVPFLSIIARSQLLEIESKETSKCLVGSRYGSRDSDINRWLPVSQPKVGACVISTLELSSDWTFAEVAAKVLGFGVHSSKKLMGQILIDQAHIMTLPQAEEMVEMTERDGDTSMRIDGYGNFFFVETGSEDDPVSVVRVGRKDSSRWYTRVYKIGDKCRRRHGPCFLIPNLDASKL